MSKERATADARLVGAGPILVLGRAGMDFYADPPGTRIEEADRFVACLGGSSANIAVALVRHGLATGLLSTVSEDAVGRFVLAELDRYGIDRTHVRSVRGEVRTSLAVVETRLEDTQSVIYRNGAADFEMTDADVDAVDFAAWSALILTGTALAAEPSRSACLRALDRARAAGLALILDLDYRPYSWTSAAEAAEVLARAAGRCDIVVGNDVEFGVLAGGAGAGLDAARALGSSGAALVVYKMGEAGAVTVTPEGEFATGIYRTDALKPTGAGDAFMGGLISGLAGGLAPRAAVLRGSANAAMVVARVGCAPAMPTLDDVREFLADGREPDPA